MTFSTPKGRRSGGSGPRQRVSPSKSASHPAAPDHRFVKTFSTRRGGCVAIGLCLLMSLLAGYVCYQIPYQQKVPAANQTWRPAHQPVHIGGLAHTEYTLAPAPPAPIPDGQVRNATSRPQPSQQLLAVQGNASGRVEQQLEQAQQLERGVMSGRRGGAGLTLRVSQRRPAAAVTSCITEQCRQAAAATS